MQPDYAAVPIGPKLQVILAIAYQVRRPVLLQGRSGIGKSECVRAAADRLEIDFEALDLSLLEPPDLVGLPYLDNGRTAYAAPTTLPTGGAGILLLEELNRAERYIRQPVLQLLSARRLNEYRLPEGWSVVAAINPQDGDYDVDRLGPAFIDRFLCIEASADRDSWLDWANAHGIHPAVLELARQHDRLLEDVSPRRLEYASDLLHCCAGDDAPDDDLFLTMMRGYLPEAWATTLLSVCGRLAAGSGLEVEELLKRYADDSKLRRRVAALRAKGRTDVLEQLAWKVIRITHKCDLTAMSKAGRFSLDAFERLLEDLPGDHAERAQLAFGDNKSAIGLLQMHPSLVLAGYRRDGSARCVDAWLSRSCRRHRAWAVATGVADFLQNKADLKVVRTSLDARRNLGLLLQQLAGKRAKRLAETLDRLSIRPVRPRKTS